MSAPSPWLSALEVRAIGERLHMSAVMPALRRFPAGDGHPVLVFPGFSASDRSTAQLRGLLDDLGYRTAGWGLGVNVGPTNEVLDGVARALDRVSGGGREPVSIIGWSLGGIYARELARARPAQVRQVITMGSPIQMTEGGSPAGPTVRNGARRDDPHASAHDARRTPHLPVPSTSIYSRTDGVVRWQASLIHRTSISENVRVHGSHCGLGFNAAALFVIADRLAQPPGTWRHFTPPWYLRGAFPRPVDLDDARRSQAAA
jgi:pimeloyl-ACP methyl ester carboxylesterase